MGNSAIRLEYLEKGYGIAYFHSSASPSGATPEFIVQSLEKGEGERANAAASRAWAWVQKNIEAAKDYLAAGLEEKFIAMREKKERNVPPDSAVAIRQRLAETEISRITFYPNQNSFVMDFMGEFNGYSYRMYVSANDDSLTFKDAGILTMGGFKPPKDEPKQDLKNADALYDYHLRHGAEKGLYKHYVALPKKQIDAFVERLISDSETDEDERTDLALYLALFSYNCGETLPDKLYRYLIDNEIYYYGEIYLRAKKKFAEELITRLGKLNGEGPDRLTANHILCALAAMPCQTVNDFFIESSAPPLPAWAEKLHIAPKDYAKVGGWETAALQEPHILFSEKITAFERCKREKGSAPTSLDEKCGFCGRPLTLVFNDGAGQLATCLHCACYQTVFIETGENGVRWSGANEPGSFFQRNPEYMKNSEDIATQLKNGMKPTKEKRRASFTANEFANITRTQLGGMPTVINDIEYPVCPKCKKTMRFAAQFDMADIEDGEGLYYFFGCDDCGIIGSNYNQS